jgi:hypothetical protein
MESNSGQPLLRRSRRGTPIRPEGISGKIYPKIS